MSGLLMPILAIGGIVILGEYLTKKKKKHDSDSSRSSSSSSSYDSSSKKSIKRKKHKSKKTKTKDEFKTDSILKLGQSKTKTKKVSKDKSNRKLYVFYKLGEKRGKKWRYHKLPKGWHMKKKTNIVHENYSKEVVFEGPKSDRDKMNKYLEKVFSYLKKNKLVKNYKISKESK